jgi:hypothetical protein
VTVSSNFILYCCEVNQIFSHDNHGYGNMQVSNRKNRSRQRGEGSIIATKFTKTEFNPPEADEGLIPRPLGRLKFSV